MTNARRVGRELALKALFQIDIGKQPLSEVIIGAEGQIIQGLLQPSGQAVREAQADVKSILKPHEPELTTQTRRQVRKAGTDCMKAMKNAAAHVETIARQCIEDPLNVDIASIVHRISTATDIGINSIAESVNRDGFRDDLVQLLVEAVQTKTKVVGISVSRTINSSVVASKTFHALVHGVQQHLIELDDRISSLSAGWTLDRQPAVDRNVLRVAVYELLFMPEVPAGVVINEAVDLAKKYSTADSGKFVNGILGALATSQRPDEEYVVELDSPVPRSDSESSLDDEPMPILFEAEGLV